MVAPITFAMTLLVTIATVIAAPSSSAANYPIYPGLDYLGSMEVSEDGHSVQETTYYVSRHKLTWKQADEYCPNNMTNGYLLAIETPWEDRFIHERLITSTENKIGEPIWTAGYFNQSASDWYWFSTKEAFTDYRNWRKPDEPSKNGTYARVAFTSRDLDQYAWSTLNDEQHYFVCEVNSIRNDTPVPCKKETDLVIVLDGSGSIDPMDFLIAQNFTALLSSAFGKPHSPSRVSVIVFSTSIETLFTLSEHNQLSPADIDYKIRTAFHPQGSTNTHLGINSAVAQLIGNPSGIPRKMVVLTDGVSSNKPFTAVASADAEANQVTSYSVGIGSNVEMEELLTIARWNENHVFTVDQFSDLMEIIAPVSIAVCQD